MGERDVRDKKGDASARERGDVKLVPGKQTNTESLEGKVGATPRTPGRRSMTETLAGSASARRAKIAADARGWIANQ